MKNLMKYLPLINKLSSKTNPDNVTIILRNPKTGAITEYSIQADTPVLEAVREKEGTSKFKLPQSLSIRDLLGLAKEGSIELKDVKVK